MLDRHHIPRSASLTRGQHGEKLALVFIDMQKKFLQLNEEVYPGWWPIYEMAAEITATQRNTDSKVKKKQGNESEEDDPEAQGEDEDDEKEDEEGEGEEGEGEGDDGKDERTNSPEVIVVSVPNVTDVKQTGVPAESKPKPKPKKTEVAKEVIVHKIKTEEPTFDGAKLFAQFASLAETDVHLETDGYEVVKVDHSEAAQDRKDPDGHAVAERMADPNRPPLEHQALWAKLGPVLANYAIGVSLSLFRNTSTDGGLGTPA